MREAGLEEDDQGFRIGGRNLNNLLRYADDRALTAENLEDLRTLIRKVKEQTELQLSMKNTEVMMTGKITASDVFFNTFSRPQSFTCSTNMFERLQKQIGRAHV